MLHNKRPYTARCVLKTNQEIEIAHLQSSLAGVMREGFDCTPLFLSVFSLPSMHATPGLFSWTMELMAFASRQLAR